MLSKAEFGRSDRVRTCGIDVPNVARYQLRHTPKYLIYCFLQLSAALPVATKPLPSPKARQSPSCCHSFLLAFSATRRRSQTSPTAPHPEIFNLLFLLQLSAALSKKACHSVRFYAAYSLFFRIRPIIIPNMPLKVKGKCAKIGELLILSLVFLLSLRFSWVFLPFSPCFFFHFNSPRAPFTDQYRRIY